MKEFIKKLFDELQEELSIYNDLGTLPIRKVVGALHSISEAIDKLKAKLKEHKFILKEDEIHFFKYEKPAFVAEQFYAMEIFTIETGRPLNDLGALKNFYEQELKYIKRFFEQHRFLYAYYQFDMKDMDHLLFIRGAKPTDIPIPETIGLDPAFSATCDVLFGKFIAFERLQQHLIEEISSLENPMVPQQANADNQIEIKWTGETINLVELAYGLWLTGQINNGNASITEIIQWLEVHFQVKIGRAYRRWTSISGRKRVSQTKFMDQLRDAIQRRLDDENDVK